MSDHHTSPLRPEDEDLLQAALSDPFSVSNLRRVSPSHPAESAPPTGAPPPAAAAAPPSTTPESSSSSSAGQQEAWKAEYEAQVVEWRRQSAAVRARAEAERARWDERRAHEEQQAVVAPAPAGAGAGGGAAGGASVSGQSMSMSASASEWEAVSQRSVAGSSSLAPGDARAGQGQSGGTHYSQAQGPHPPPSNITRSATGPGAHPPRSSPSAGPQAASGPAAAAAAAADPSDSPHWETVPSSIASSFPSLSFPEPSRPHSPEHSHAPPHSAATVRTPTAASVTLAVFDDTLSTRSRFWALLSSLSINLVLPFVNGVMLGFGEIFAKTVVVGWLGWGPSVATNVGLGRSQSRWR